MAISLEQKAYIVQLMMEGKNGQPMGQREIERETGLNRNSIRKIAREVGYQFPRFGIEVVGELCMCKNCMMIFRRNPSRIRLSSNFCSVECSNAFQRGPSHPSYKTGVTMKSFSTWVLNQKEYKRWREDVLARDNYTCVITGRKDNLEAHHIFPKGEVFNPEKAFDSNNGITINKEVHTRIHQLISKGCGFQEAIEKVKEEYKKEKE